MGVPSRSGWRDSTGVKPLTLPSPSTSVSIVASPRAGAARASGRPAPRRSMGAILGTISYRMRRSFFSRNPSPQPEPAGPVNAAESAGQRPRTGKTFPADEVVWGIAIRNGFDEMDDPGYHRGTTQHAYLEGNDNVAICGFRPPQSGPRTRRRSRLGLPSSGENPMCGMCARMVVAPRPRVPIPIQPGRPPVALPIAPGTLPAPVAPGAGPPMTAGAMPSARAGRRNTDRRATRSRPAVRRAATPGTRERPGRCAGPHAITMGATSIRRRGARAQDHHRGSRSQAR